MAYFMNSLSSKKTQKLVYFEVLCRSRFFQSCCVVCREKANKKCPQQALFSQISSYHFSPKIAGKRAFCELTKVCRKKSASCTFTVTEYDYFFLKFLGNFFFFRKMHLPCNFLSSLLIYCMEKLAFANIYWN